MPTDADFDGSSMSHGRPCSSIIIVVIFNAWLNERGEPEMKSRHGLLICCYYEVVGLLRVSLNILVPIYAVYFYISHINVYDVIYFKNKLPFFLFFERLL